MLFIFDSVDFSRVRPKRYFDGVREALELRTLPNCTAETQLTDINPANCFDPRRVSPTDFGPLMDQRLFNVAFNRVSFVRTSVTSKGVDTFFISKGRCPYDNQISTMLSSAVSKTEFRVGDKDIATIFRAPAP